VPARRRLRGGQSRTNTDRLAARGGATSRVGSARDGRHLRRVSSATLHIASRVRVGVQHDNVRATIVTIAVRFDARRERVRGAFVFCDKHTGAGRIVGTHAGASGGTAASTRGRREDEGGRRNTPRGSRAGTGALCVREAGTDTAKTGRTDVPGGGPAGQASTAGLAGAAVTHRHRQARRSWRRRRPRRQRT
jgi:hypothetical protein